MIGTSERVAQRTADRVAVAVGQPQVEEHAVGGSRFEGRGAGRSTFDLEALALQTLRQRLGDRVLVLDEQNLHACIVASGNTQAIGDFPNPYQSLPNLWRRLAPSLSGAPVPLGSMNKETRMHS